MTDRDGKQPPQRGVQEAAAPYSPRGILLPRPGPHAPLDVEAALTRIKQRFPNILARLGE